MHMNTLARSPVSHAHRMGAKPVEVSTHGTFRLVRLNEVLAYNRQNLESRGFRLAVGLEAGIFFSDVQWNTIMKAIPTLQAIVYKTSADEDGERTFRFAYDMRPQDTRVATGSPDEGIYALCLSNDS